MKETRAKDWDGTKDSLSKWGNREVLCLFWIFTKGEAPAAGIADENGMVENRRLWLQGRGGYFRSKVLEEQRRDGIKRC